MDIINIFPVTWSFIITQMHAIVIFILVKVQCCDEVCVHVCSLLNITSVQRLGFIFVLQLMANNEPILRACPGFSMKYNTI